MRFRVVARYVGFSLILNAVFLLLASLLSAGFSDPAFLPLIYSALVSFLFGVFPMVFVPATTDISDKEGLVIVVASWVLSCLIGTLPYFLWGAEFTFTNAWFESVSGYTTTGCSVLRDVEALPPGLLFWRSLTHWIGGIGILVFVLAALPFMAGAEKILYSAEASSLSRENFRYRTRRVIQILVVVYVGLTLLETLSLVLCGMNLFDALTHTFATVATGGFSTKNQSVAYFHSVSAEIVIILFMMLSGIHFGLLFSAVSGDPARFWKSSVVSYYVLAMLAGIGVVSADVCLRTSSPFWESLRLSAFQIVSVGSSTGFATTDTTVWPPLSQLVLILFTLQCACAGSTSGGIKADRIIIFGKTFMRAARKMLHPAEILSVRIDRRPLDEEVVGANLLYITTYVAAVVLSTLLLAAQGLDLLSAFSGSAACMGNVGPGLGTVGSMGNFAHLPAFSKWVLSFVMLLGRLEIYGMLALLIPRLWRWT
jgi:trk system potassium uptake protein TrkH